MKINLQPNHLKNEFIYLVPLKENDFEILFSIANDPLIWEQHPQKNRYKKEVFIDYFDSAIASNGAFLVYDVLTNNLIGSSRFYNYKAINKSIFIGFTFIIKSYWGTPYNHALKKLMLDYAFKFVNDVFFDIGINNIRSQKAIEKLGAIKINSGNAEFTDDLPIKNYLYKISKLDWIKANQLFE